MIFKDIAEWEVGDSELAQHTITNLHYEINRLNNIIKEAREYLIKNIEQWENSEDFTEIVEEDEYILILLDKEK